MKKTYIQPQTSTLYIKVETDLTISSNEKEGRDPVENPINQGSDNEDPAKWFNPDWDFDPEWNFEE